MYGGERPGFEIDCGSGVASFCRGGNVHLGLIERVVFGWRACALLLGECGSSSMRKRCRGCVISTMVRVGDGGVLLFASSCFSFSKSAEAMRIEGN